MRVQTDDIIERRNIDFIAALIVCNVQGEGSAIAQAVFPPRRYGFELRSSHVGFVVDKGVWDRFAPSIPVFSANFHSTDCSTFIFVYHPGLIEYANLWPTYQVDSVSPYARKLIYRVKLCISK
jgi:hypothetical protein